ncbi:MAG: hypothetical protein ABII27_05490 [bacterium]
MINFMPFRITTSFLASITLHLILFLFIVFNRSPMQQLGDEIFMPSQVDVLEGSEAKRIREWLKEIQAARPPEADVAQPSVIDIRDIRENLFRNLGITEEVFTDIPPIETGFLDSFLKDTLADIPISNDATESPALKETPTLNSKVDGGTFEIQTADALGKPLPKSGGPDRANEIKIAFNIDDTPDTMAIIDKPVYIASKPKDFTVEAVKTQGSTADEKPSVIHTSDKISAKIIGELINRDIEKYEMPEIPFDDKIKVKKLFVHARITVLGNGKVKDNIVIEKTSGYDSIDKSVADSLLKWTFTPLPKKFLWQEQMGVIVFEINLI